MSLQAGGLSDDSQACIKDVFAELGVPSETMSEIDSLRSFITMQLCLTDEEAQALDASGGEDPLPLPSQLRCISEQTELENLFIIYQAFVDLGVEHGAAHTIAGNDDGGGRDNGGSGDLRHSHHHPRGGVNALGGGSGYCLRRNYGY